MSNLFDWMATCRKFKLVAGQISNFTYNRMKQIIREGRGKREPQTRSRTGNNNKGKFVEVGAIIMRPICDYFVISMDC